MFAGGITNNGRLTAGIGIFVCTLGSLLPSTFSGGITNSGAIAAQVVGIEVANVSTFTGCISNNGTISALGTGIAVGGLFYTSVQFRSLTVTSSSRRNSPSASTAAQCVAGLLTTVRFLAPLRQGNPAPISWSTEQLLFLVASPSRLPASWPRKPLSSCGPRNLLAVRVEVNTLSGNVTNSGKISATKGDGIDILLTTRLSGDTINTPWRRADPPLRILRRPQSSTAPGGASGESVRTWCRACHCGSFGIS
jgi:hypothetical protein